GLFLIKAQRDVPGYALSKRHHPVPQSHDLVLNTLPLAEHLLDQLARLSAGETAASLSLPAEADDPAFRDLMGRLVQHWGAGPQPSVPPACAPRGGWGSGGGSGGSGSPSPPVAPPRRGTANGWSRTRARAASR